MGKPLPPSSGGAGEVDSSLVLAVERSDSAASCVSSCASAVLAGSRDFIKDARRLKQLFGGAMRQAGIIAAAGVYALQHHVERLAEDHDNARQLASALAAIPTVQLNPAEVETNIVIWELAPDVPFDAAGFVSRAREHGVLLNAMGERRVRAVTHLDVDAAACSSAAERLCAMLKAA